jgi:hypothetical protein
MLIFPELPPQINQIFPPAKSPVPEGTPARYPWPEVIDTPIPLFARQAPQTPKLGEALIQSEALPTIPFVFPINVMRY